MRRSGSRIRAWSWLVPCGAAALAVAIFSATGAAHPIPVGVTWTGTVARTLERRCVSCHGRSGVANPRLDDYESARLASQAIRTSVLTRHMPQWHATSGFGAFANDPTLTPHEIERVAQWADALAPYGDVPSLPAAPTAIVHEAPPPDLQLTVSGSGHGDASTRTFLLDPRTTGERWLRGWTFDPGTRTAASAVLSLESGATLHTWVAGERRSVLPEGVAWRLPRRGRLRLTVHYRTPPSGAGTSSVGLYFSERPDRQLAQMVLPCGSTRLARAVEVLGVRPRIGSAAWSLAVIARQPGGKVQPLGQFQQYPDTHAQTYWLANPAALPAGASIEVGATHGTCGAELDYVVSAQRRGVGRERRHSERPRPLSADMGRSLESVRRPSAPAGDEYWCPMHPAVRSPGPGACHQCGMALVPVTPAVEGAYSLDVDWLPTEETTGTLRLVVREPGTRALVRDFERVHERPFHLFVVSDNLREFSHVHPVARPDGSLELTGLPLPAGPYQLYADFLPVGGTPQLIRKTLPAGLDSGFSGSRTPHLVPDVVAKSDGRLRVRIDAEGAALTAGAPGLIAFHLEDAATGAPVADLDPYLGAWGHAFILSADLQDAVHSHPLTPLSSPGGPTIYFQQRFPRAGKYRMWVQFQRRGVLSTVPFTVSVTDAAPVSWGPEDR